MLHSTLVVFEVHLGIFRQSKILFPFSLAILFFFFFFSKVVFLFYVNLYKNLAHEHFLCAGLFLAMFPPRQMYLHLELSSTNLYPPSKLLLQQMKQSLSLKDLLLWLFFFFFSPFTVYDTFMHSWNYFIYNWLGCTCCFVPVWRSSQTAGSKRKSSQTCWS